MHRHNEKTVDDNKKHKRNLSTPIILSGDYSNDSATSDRLSIAFNGIFSPRTRPKPYNQEIMAEAFSDSSMSRVAKSGVVNGRLNSIMDTESELEGVSRQSSIRLRNHRNSEGYKSERIYNEPGKHIKKLS